MLTTVVLVTPNVIGSTNEAFFALAAHRVGPVRTLPRLLLPKTLPGHARRLLRLRRSGAVHREYTTFLRSLRKQTTTWMYGREEKKVGKPDIKRRADHPL